MIEIDSNVRNMTMRLPDSILPGFDATERNHQSCIVFFAVMDGREVSRK